MNKPFLPNFIKVCDLQSNVEGSVIIIEDPKTHNKFVQKIISTNKSKIDIKSFCNADIIKCVSICKGILPIISFSCQPYPTIITEYKTNGTLKDFITKRFNEEQIHTDPRTLMILYGIANSMNYLHIHHLYFDKIDTSKIYLDDNLFPQINISDLLMTETPPKYDLNRLKDDVFSFGIIAFELITGKTSIENADTINKSLKTGIEWLDKLIRKCISKYKHLMPHFDDIINEIKEQNKNYELISKEEIDKYEAIQASSLSEYLSSIFEFSSSSKYMKCVFGNIFYYGIGVETNKRKASSFYKLAADEGHLDSMYNYAVMLLKGDGIEMNKREASKYFKHAADQGHSSSMYNYAVMLYKGDGIEMNKQEASKYFKLATKEGSLDSMYSYGIMLRNGEGIEMNKQEASKYFKLAADEGHSSSMCNYAFMLYKGDGIEMNKQEASKYFKLAADEGHSSSMCNYAVMLYKGDGIEMNKQEASKYFKLAADEGHLNSICNYAVMLYKGDGIEINKREASKYFKLAADEGHLNSMYTYAVMIYKGDGIEINKREAHKYFKLAAEKGHLDSIKQYRELTKYTAFSL